MPINDLAGTKHIDKCLKEIIECTKLVDNYAKIQESRAKL